MRVEFGAAGKIKYGINGITYPKGVQIFRNKGKVVLGFKDSRGQFCKINRFESTDVTRICK